MDAKEVELRGKAITKAIQEKQSSSTIINLLGELRKGVSASEDLLRSTKIGIIVNRLKQHPDPNVQKLANELVSKWRTDMKRTGGPATPKSANGTASPAPAATPSAAPKPKPKHNIPPEQRNSKTDKVNTNLTDSAIRNNCIKLMYDGLAHMVDDCKCLVSLP
jgi:transcription elongation factor S-II